MVDLELGKSLLNIVANFREDSIVLTLIFGQTFLAVEVAAHRVAVLNFNFGVIFAKEFLGVENKVGCKLKTRRCIFFLRLKFVEARASISVRVIFKLK